MSKSWPKRKIINLKNNIMVSVLLERDSEQPFTPEFKRGVLVFDMTAQGVYEPVRLIKLGIAGYERYYSNTHGYMVFQDELLDICRELEQLERD